MSRLRVGVVRYAAVADAIRRALGEGDGAPDCRIGHGRVTLTFRRTGATRWPEARRVEHALHAAAAARAVLTGDARASLRARAGRAIEVVYEDAAVVRGCVVTARWECVVPGTTPAHGG